MSNDNKQNGNDEKYFTPSEVPLEKKVLFGFNTDSSQDIGREEYN
jgi:hypothetical protein